MLKCRKITTLGLVSLVIGLSSCHSQQEQSRVDGHYEDSSAEEMANFIGAQTVVPEYESSSRVIIGSPLLQYYNKVDLVEAILDAGVDEVLVTVSQGASTSTSGPLFSRLRAKIGSRIDQVRAVNQAERGGLTVWARDWAPLGAETSGLGTFGDGLSLVDFNYYPRRQADDATARALETVFSSKRISVPVYNEGGNFMINSSGDCMMSDRVVQANARKFFPNDLILDEAQIKTYYKQFAGCKSVYIFPRMPREGTGHIDMWAKFLDDQTVLVSEMRDDTLMTMPATSSNRALALQVQKYLNDRADEIAALGFDVVRVPMPSPIAGRLVVMRSYTNSLLANGTAIVPRYVKPALGLGTYQDLELI